MRFPRPNDIDAWRRRPDRDDEDDKRVPVLTLGECKACGAWGETCDGLCARCWQDGDA